MEKRDGEKGENMRCMDSDWKLRQFEKKGYLIRI